MFWNGYKGGIGRAEVRMKGKKERKDKGMRKEKCTNGFSRRKDHGKECDCFLA
jgi:hypothetical protein